MAQSALKNASSTAGIIPQNFVDEIEVERPKNMNRSVERYAPVDNPKIRNLNILKVHHSVEILDQQDPLEYSELNSDEIIL